MINKIDVIRDLKENLQKQYHDSRKEVILFGSQVKDIANENSDFDVLILLDRNYSGKDENQIFDICFSINLKYNIFIDAHLLSIKKLTTIRGKQRILNVLLDKCKDF